MLALRRCLKVESEICAKATLSPMPRTIPDHLDPLAWKRERWPIAAVASTQPRLKAPPGGGTGRGLGVRSLSRIKCAGAPDYRSGGLSFTLPPERCGGYAVRPARSGRSPPCNDTE